MPELVDQALLLQQSLPLLSTGLLLAPPKAAHLGLLPDHLREHQGGKGVFAGGTRPGCGSLPCTVAGRGAPSSFLPTCRGRNESG